MSKLLHYPAAGKTSPKTPKFSSANIDSDPAPKGTPTATGGPDTKPSKSC